MEEFYIIIKPLKENTRENPCDPGFGKDFLDVIPKTQRTKEKN